MHYLCDICSKPITKGGAVAAGEIWLFFSEYDLPDAYKKPSLTRLYYRLNNKKAQHGK